jgi:hypothetical protein
MGSSYKSSKSQFTALNTNSIRYIPNGYGIRPYRTQSCVAFIYARFDVAFSLAHRSVRLGARSLASDITIPKYSGWFIEFLQQVEYGISSPT